MTDKNLEIKLEAQKIQELYSDDPRSKTFNAIIYGGTGTGKSSLLRTCRLPLHVDSFDPGGASVLVGKATLNGVSYPDEYSKGNIVLDTRFEVEDPLNPSAAKLWDDEFHRRKKMGYFEALGTYVIDSMTTWSQVIMYAIMKKAGRTGGHPYENDWLPQMQVIENAMRDFLSLPCDCILIGHDDEVKDGASGRVFFGLLITGKLKKRVPPLFSEMYCAQTKETNKGLEYQLLTRASGAYQARTRLGKNGELDTYEKPIIKDILKKVGMPTDDKSSLTGG